MSCLSKNIFKVLKKSKALWWISVIFIMFEEEKYWRFSWEIIQLSRRMIRFIESTTLSYNFLLGVLMRIETKGEKNLFTLMRYFYLWSTLVVCLCRSFERENSQWTGISALHFFMFQIHHLISINRVSSGIVRNFSAMDN